MSSDTPKRKIFISYARKDSTKFALEITKQLEKDYDVWIDIIKMPNRGQPFPQEIEHAIQNVDFLLLLLSPGSANSDWVEKEWQYALQFGIPIIPLLHLGKGKLSEVVNNLGLPDQLRILNILDFRKNTFSARTEAYEKLEYALKGPLPVLAPLHLVPKLDYCYFPRTDELQQLNVMMFRNIDINRPIVISSEQQTSALHGMGGIGKTVLATAFVHQRQTRSMFKDGIFWFEIGQNPSIDKLYSYMRTLGIAFGDDVSKYVDYNSACSQLGATLQRKNVLIVLDNVWDTSAVQPFKSALGSACCLLITTRDLHVSRRLTGREQTLTIRSMSNEQAAGLLHKITGKVEPQYSDIAQRLGGLPLALNLVGQRLLQGMTAQEWLNEYDKASSLGLVEDPRDEDKSLAICIDLSVSRVFEEKEDQRKPEEKERKKLLYYTLGIFPEHSWIPERVVMQLWTLIRSDISRQKFQNVIYALADLALIDLNTENHTIHLHDLVYDHNRERLGESYPYWQNQLLLSYNYGERPWYQVPDDGYLYDNLAYHLLKAQKTDVLQSLLLSYKWLQARLNSTDRVSSVLSDFDTYFNAEPAISDSIRSALDKVKVAIQLSTYVVALHHDQLWSQLYGRLMNCQEAAIQQFLQVAPAQLWMRPEHEYLMPPGTALKYTLSGHTDAISSLGGVVGSEGFIASVSVTANSEVGLTGAFDGTVRLWDIKLGRLLETLKGHQLPVTSVAVTGDGKSAVSGSIDNTLIKWDLSNNTSVSRHFSQEWGSVFSVAISADGRWAAAGYQNGNIILWDFETGEWQEMQECHEGAVVAITMSADAAWAVTGSHDQTVRYWNLKTKELIHTFTGHQAPVLSVALHNQEFAVSASADGSLRTWDLKTGQSLRTIQAYKDVPVHSVVLDSQGEYAVSGSYAGAIQIWDLANGEKVYEVFGHSRQVMSVALAPDGNALLSGGCDNVLKIWDLREKAPSPTFTAPGRGVFALATHRAKGLLATIEDNYSISLRDIRDGSVQRNLPGHRTSVQAVAFSHDGARVASGSLDCTVQVWDVASGTLLHRLEGHEREVHSVAFSPDGKMIAAGYSGSNLATSIVKTWDLDTGQELMTYTGHEGDVVTLAFTPDSQFLLSGSADKTLRVWDVLNGETVQIFRRHTDIVKSVVVSKDGRFAVSGGCDRVIYIWDIKTGEIIQDLLGNKHFIWTLRLNDDNTRLLSTSEDHSVRIWDLKTKKVITSFFCDNVLFTGDFVSDDFVVVGAAASREPYFFTLVQP